MGKRQKTHLLGNSYIQIYSWTDFHKTSRKVKRAKPFSVLICLGWLHRVFNSLIECHVIYILNESNLELIFRDSCLPTCCIDSFVICLKTAGKGIFWEYSYISKQAVRFSFQESLRKSNNVLSDLLCFPTLISQKIDLGNQD